MLLHPKVTVTLTSASTKLNTAGQGHTRVVQGGKPGSYPGLDTDPAARVWMKKRAQPHRADPPGKPPLASPSLNLADPHKERP